MIKKHVHDQQMQKVQIKIWFKTANDVSGIFGLFGGLSPIAARGAFFATCTMWRLSLISLASKASRACRNSLLSFSTWALFAFNISVAGVSFFALFISIAVVGDKFARLTAAMRPTEFF